MKYLWVSALAVLGSCQPEDCCTIVDTAVGISYRDARGQDWLRTQHVTVDNMEVYALRDNQKVRVYQPNLDAPKNIRLDSRADSSLSILTLYPEGRAGANGEAVTLLEFPDHRVDTVQCRFRQEGSSTSCVNVRYNGQQCWSAGAGTGRYFTVSR